MNACVYFHQGWTDIIICLALIDFYKEQNDLIFPIIRSDAKELFDFYIKSKSGIYPIYINTDSGRYYGNVTHKNIQKIEYVPEGHAGNIFIPDSTKLLFHAEHDRFRDDDYKFYWYKNNPRNLKVEHFSEAFYLYYDIPLETKIDFFNINRDFECEEKEYKKFINENSEKYILYHDDQFNHLNGSYHVSTQLNIINKKERFRYVNLNKKTNKFFDFIKILTNAEEIHLIDSIWGCLCYHLDCKYGLFKDKQIFLYPLRGHENMFLKPKKLNNWHIIK